MKTLKNTVASIALIALLGGISGCAETKTEQQRMSDAQTAFEEGKYRASLIELKNLLQENPKNKDARVLLARASLEIGDADAASKELERASRLGATDNEIYALQQQTWLRLGNYQELIDNYSVNKSETAEERDQLQLVYARALNGLDRKAEARSEFQNLVDAASSPEWKAEALVGLALIARTDGNEDEAKDLAVKALEVDSSLASAHITLGQIGIAAGRFDEAYGRFVEGQKATNVNEEQKFVLLSGELEAALGAGNIDGSKDAANRLFSLAPEHPITNYLLARVAYVSGDKALAHEKAQKVLSEYPEFLPAQFLQGALSIERQEYPQAEMFLSNVVAAQPMNVEARRMLAEANLRLGNEQAAVNVLREGLQLGAGSEELSTMLGRINMRSNNSQENIAMLEQTLANNPDNEQTQLTLVGAYIAAGRAADAQRLIESTDNEGITSERRAIVKLVAAMQAEDREAAIAQADIITATWPDNPRTHNMIGMWLVSQGLKTKGRTVLERSYEKNPDFSMLVDSLSRIDNQDGKPEDAEARFQDFLSRNPDATDAWIALTSMYASNGDTPKAVETLRSAIEQLPDAHLPKVILTRLLIGSGQLAEATELAEEAAKTHDRIGVTQLMYGRVLFEQGQYDLALEYLKKADLVQPGQPETIGFRARTEARMQRYAQAKKSYQALWDLNPGNLEAAQSIALIEQRAGNTAAAGEMLKQLRELRPDDPRVNIIDADLKAERGNNQAAMELYEQAYSLRPSRDLAIKMARLAPTQGERSETYLRRWLEQSPDDVAARLALAQDFQQNGNRDKAIEEYEIIVRSRPRDSLVLNNLAWLYFESDKPGSNDRALELSERAYEVSPNSPQVADTYGWVLFRTGNVSKGVEVLALADTQARDSGLNDARDITYHYAAALNESGDSAGARLRLKSILNDNRPFYSRDEAKTLLDSLER